MAIASFTFDNLVYSDAVATNNPQYRDWDYKKTLNVASLLTPDAKRVVLPAGNTTIQIPAATANFLFIEVDGTVKLRFNGMTSDEIDVSPSVAGTSDGVLFKRGAYTSLVVHNPGVDDVNAVIFMGV